MYFAFYCSCTKTKMNKQKYNILCPMSLFSISMNIIIKVGERRLGRRLECSEIHYLLIYKLIWGYG